MRASITIILINITLLINAQEKLPDWFLNPPVSPDNSCVYLIGISDPGLNRDDATLQAVARAKTFMNASIQKIEKDFKDFTMMMDNVTEVVSRNVISQKYLSANFELVNSFVTNYNEVIVLMKYSFMERPKSTKTDSVQIKSMLTYYMHDDGKNSEAILEHISKIIDVSNIVEAYYSLNQKNRNDSITSFIQTTQKEITPNLNELNNHYPNQKGVEVNPLIQKRFTEDGSATYNLKNGLWCAYLNCFRDATSKINNAYTETLKNLSQTFTGSMTVIKGISIKDNTLEVLFGGTLYTDGFITKTYPEDVDTNIPQNQQKRSNRFALVIGNEDYNSFQQGLNSEVNVDFAVNDAVTFEQYAIKTLGVPTENAVLLTNAKAMDMHKAIDKLALLAKSLNGKAELIFYYAGHGFPDEQTKEPYLIPVDVSGSDLRFAINLKDLYAKLSQYPTQRVTVILDACFSGGARNQGLVAARGVKVKPKESDLSGNLVVFAASSGDQSSLPYKEKKHGMFTYLLLKKLQETKGDITYEELFNHLQEQVGVKSLLINSKEQTPQANASPTLGDDWKGWKVK